MQAAAIDSSRKETLRNWIRFSSLVMILIYVTRFILSVSLFDFNSPDNSFTIPFSLAVAYCGIIGSQRMHRDMLACFYTCCYLNICLYFVNVLIQTKDLIKLKQDGADDSKDVFLIYYIAIGLQTLLALSQYLGASWGKELVTKHLNVTFVQRGFPASYRSEFVQQSGSENSDDPKRNENVRYTIHSIPEYVYSTKSPDCCLTSKRDGSSSSQAISLATAVVLPSPNSFTEVELTPNVLPVENEDCDICVICQDDFHDGDWVKKLHCSHIYHAGCINDWLERSLCCPMCMSPITLLIAPSSTNEVQPSSESLVSSRVLLIV